MLQRRARPPAVGTTAQPYTAGRLAFFVTAVRKSASEVPLRSIDALRYAPDIVRSQPRTASLLSGNSVLRAVFGSGRPTPLRLASVVQRFCAGQARGEPYAELPAAHARRQWFMTAEEGVRLRSSLFWGNGPAGVCKAVFVEPIAPTSVKLQRRVGIALLQGVHNQTFL